MKQAAIDKLDPLARSVADCIINTNAREGQHFLDQTMLAPPKDMIQILEACLADETAQGRSHARVVMVKTLKSAIRKLTMAKNARKLGLPEEAVSLVAAEAGQPEVLTPLQEAAHHVNAALDAIEEHHESFRRASLPEALRAGLHCLKAHAEFAVVQQTRNPKGRNQHSKEVMSRRDMTSSPDSFETWLASDTPRLKRQTAYKYMSACKGLGLDAKSEPAAVDAALGRLARPPTLNELIGLAGGGVAPPAPQGQLPLDLVFEGMKGFRLSCEHLVRLRDQMDPQRYKVAVARVYTTLKAMTGIAWKPCDRDEPDPDDITMLDLSALTEESAF